MIRNNLKSGLVALAAFIGLAVFVSPAKAVDDTILFEATPLFSEASLVPGQQVTRWVRIQNNADFSRQAGLVLYNLVDPEGFGDRITLRVSQGDDELFAMSLSELAEQEETALAPVLPGQASQFDLTATLDPAADNSYQGLDLKFDLSFGLSEEERREEVVVYGGGGGVVYLDPPRPEPDLSGNDFLEPDDKGLVAGAETGGDGRPALATRKPGSPAGFFIPRAQASEGEQDSAQVGDRVTGLFTGVLPGSAWWGGIIFWGLLLVILLALIWQLLSWRRRKERSQKNNPPPLDPPSF